MLNKLMMNWKLLNNNYDLDFAAETGFGLTKPHGLNEMFGLSLSRLKLS